MKVGQQRATSRWPIPHVKSPAFHGSLGLNREWKAHKSPRTLGRCDAIAFRKGPNAMTRSDTLHSFRPVNAVKRLGNNPACVLSGLLVQRALTLAASRLPVFELASVRIEARGLLRAAQNLDVALSLAFRPRLDVRAPHFSAFVREVLEIADLLGYRQPLLLCAGPFYLAKLDDSSLKALRLRIFDAVDAGFTEIAIAPQGGLATDEVAKALAPATALLAERGLLLELILPASANAREFQSACISQGVAVEVFSSSDPAGDRARAAPPATWGVRPRDAQLPAAFDQRISRLALDPFSEIVLQVLPDDVRAEVDKLCAQGFRMSDVLGLKARCLADLGDEAAQWIESNVYGDALDLFEALSLKGSAEHVRQFCREQCSGSGEF